MCMVDPRGGLYVVLPSTDPFVALQRHFIQLSLPNTGTGQSCLRQMMSRM
eukprot:COSAG02_NODE_2456_length_8812_cov_2.849535_5_plen_50_part_00